MLARKAKHGGKGTFGTTTSVGADSPMPPRESETPLPLDTRTPASAWAEHGNTHLEVEWSGRSSSQHGKFAPEKQPSQLAQDSLLLHVAMPHRELYNRPRMREHDIFRGHQGSGIQIVVHLLVQ